MATYVWNVAPNAPGVLPMTGTVCRSDAKSSGRDVFCANDGTATTARARITKMVRFMFVCLLLPRRTRRRRLRRNVRSAVALQQSLVRRREEREVRVEVLVVDFHALGQSRLRMAGGDEADADRVDVAVVHVRLRTAAEAPAL